MVAQYFQSPIDNATKEVQHIYTGSHDTEKATDIKDCDQDGRRMVHTTKQC